VSGQRLRLTTSRPAGYRRGGQVIGGAAAPAFIGPGDVTPEQMLAILRDPNIAVAIEIEEDVFRVLTDEERAEIEERAEGAIELSPAPVSEPDTAEPQTAGTVPASEASEATGSQLAATADASDGSAADAGTNAPVQPEAAVPAPEKPAPAKPIRSGKGKKAAT